MDEGVTVPTAGAASGSELLRLTDVKLSWKFADRDKRLALLDIFLEDFILLVAIMKRQWRIGELTGLGLAFSGMVLGAWDLGIGELAGGGDYTRVGLRGFQILSDV